MNYPNKWKEYIKKKEREIKEYQILKEIENKIKDIESVDIKIFESSKNRYFLEVEGEFENRNLDIARVFTNLNDLKEYLFNVLKIKVKGGKRKK